MAGPTPTYLTTQTAAQTAFTVPFGLETLVNAAMAVATANGEFNVTVDCSLFAAEDVSNFRIYLDSLGYKVNFAKDTNNKSLNIDWGKFLDDATDATTVFQGTTPWIVAGTVTANQGAAGVDPWPVTGTITTSPDVNIHTSAGGTLSATGTSLNTNVTNFPATQPVSGTVTALQGTTPWTVDGTVAAAQSGAWSTIPDRPSQKSGRTHVSGFIDHATATTTAYTVTVGKVLYVTSMTMTGYNNGFNTAGRLRVRDNTATKIPITITPVGLGSVDAYEQIVGLTWNFPEPKRFSTNINVEVVAGTMTYSFEFTGYEE